MCLSISTPAFARGTAEEAVALTERAIEHIKAVGEEQAFKDFNVQDGDFVKGDLYVFAFDYEGVCLSHGAKTSLIGKNLVKLKDPNGTAFIQAFIDLVKKDGKGWVDYMWSNPVTKKLGNKSSYVQNVRNNLFAGVGIYKD